MQRGIWYMDQGARFFWKMKASHPFRELKGAGGEG